jgi:hypothetical protein
MEGPPVMGGRRPDLGKKESVDHCNVADEPEPPDLRSTIKIRTYLFDDSFANKPL